MCAKFRTIDGFFFVIYTTAFAVASAIFVSGFASKWRRTDTINRIGRQAIRLGFVDRENRYRI